jgi:SulP family sulfate permease
MSLNNLAMAQMNKAFSILKWRGQYSQAMFGNDRFAALIIILMVVPQSLAYAMLVGVPAEIGIFSSILPMCFILLSERVTFYRLRRLPLVHC